MPAVVVKHSDPEACARLPDCHLISLTEQPGLRKRDFLHVSLSARLLYRNENSRDVGN